MGGTQEVQLSGGQWPLDMPGQETGRVCFCMCVGVRVRVCAFCQFDGCLLLMWLIHGAITACCIHQPRCKLIYLLSNLHSPKNTWLVGFVHDNVMTDYAETH